MSKAGESPGVLADTENLDDMLSDFDLSILPSVSQLPTPAREFLRPQIDLNNESQNFMHAYNEHMVATPQHESPLDYRSTRRAYSEFRTYAKIAARSCVSLSSSAHSEEDIQATFLSLTEGLDGLRRRLLELPLENPAWLLDARSPPRIPSLLGTIAQPKDHEAIDIGTNSTHAPFGSPPIPFPEQSPWHTISPRPVKDKSIQRRGTLEYYKKSPVVSVSNLPSPPTPIAPAPILDEGMQRTLEHWRKSPVGSVSNPPSPPTPDGTYDWWPCLIRTPRPRNAVAVIMSSLEAAAEPPAGAYLPAVIGTGAEEDTGGHGEDGPTGGEDTSGAVGGPRGMLPVYPPRCIVLPADSDSLDVPTSCPHELEYPYRFVSPELPSWVDPDASAQINGLPVFLPSLEQELYERGYD
ncbi:hypothetical protein C8T65DRAFT_750609 [Cerioporus squamosus]|nr:hypothetical protein C8T65DRAFT_750609 [Cerioporus squamosus]